MRFPERVLRNVRNADRLSAKSGGTAAQVLRPDLQTVQLISKCNWQAGSRGELQMLPVLVENKNGSLDTTELLFDQNEQLAQHVGQGHSRRDHLQNLALALAQQLGLLALRDIPGDAEQSDNGTVFVSQRHLRGRQPLLFTAWQINKFIVTDHGLVACHQGLFFPKELLGYVRRMKLEIGPPDNVGRVLFAEMPFQGFVGHDEPPVAVFQKNGVRDVFRNLLKPDPVRSPAAGTRREISFWWRGRV